MKSKRRVWFTTMKFVGWLDEQRAFFLAICMKRPVSLENRTVFFHISRRLDIY